MNSIRFGVLPLLATFLFSVSFRSPAHAAGGTLRVQQDGNGVAHIVVKPNQRKISTKFTAAAYEGAGARSPKVGSTTVAYSTVTGTAKVIGLAVNAGQGGAEVPVQIWYTTTPAGTCSNTSPGFQQLFSTDPNSQVSEGAVQNNVSFGATLSELCVQARASHPNFQSPNIGYPKKYVDASSNGIVLSNGMSLGAEMSQRNVPPGAYNDQNELADYLQPFLVNDNLQLEEDQVIMLFEFGGTLGPSGCPANSSWCDFQDVVVMIDLNGSFTEIGDTYLPIRGDGSANQLPDDPSLFPVNILTAPLIRSAWGNSRLRGIAYNNLESPAELVYVDNIYTCITDGLTWSDCENPANNKLVYSGDELPGASIAVMELALTTNEVHAIGWHIAEETTGDRVYRLKFSTDNGTNWFPTPANGADTSLGGYNSQGDDLPGGIHMAVNGDQQIGILAYYDSQFAVQHPLVFYRYKTSPDTLHSQEQVTVIPDGSESTLKLATNCISDCISLVGGAEDDFYAFYYQTVSSQTYLRVAKIQDVNGTLTVVNLPNIVSQSEGALRSTRTFSGFSVSDWNPSDPLILRNVFDWDRSAPNIYEPRPNAAGANFPTGGIEGGDLENGVAGTGFYLQPVTTGGATVAVYRMDETGSTAGSGVSINDNPPLSIQGFAACGGPTPPPCVDSQTDIGNRCYYYSHGTRQKSRGAMVFGVSGNLYYTASLLEIVECGFNIENELEFLPVPEEQRVVIHQTAASL